MNLEEQKKLFFLLERGYYDDKVMAMANKNKSKDIDAYELRGDEIIVYHDGWICGYYGQQQTAPTLGKGLLKSFRTEWIKKKYPEMKKLIEKGD